MPEDITLHNHRCGNFKSYNTKVKYTKRKNTFKIREIYKRYENSGYTYENVKHLETNSDYYHLGCDTV